MSLYRSSWRGMRAWTTVRAVKRGTYPRLLARRAVYRAVRKVIR